MKINCPFCHHKLSDYNGGNLSVETKICRQCPDIKTEWSLWKSPTVVFLNLNSHKISCILLSFSDLNLRIIMNYQSEIGGENTHLCRLFGRNLISGPKLPDFPHAVPNLLEMSEQDIRNKIKTWINLS